MARDIVKLKKDYKLLSSQVLGNAVNAGAAAGSGVSRRTGTGLRTDIFTFKDVHMPMIDNAGVGAHAALKFCDMPEGIVDIEACVANLTLTKSAAGVNATWNGDFGVGSTAADNSATLATTEQNIIPTTATPAAVAGVTTAKGQQAATTIQLDGHTTPVDLYLNILVDDADQDVTTTPTDIIVNGTIRVTYANAGDN